MRVKTDTLGFIKFLAYSLSHERPDDGDKEYIVKRALELQDFIEFYREDTEDVVSSIEPTPLVLFPDTEWHLMYGEFGAYLGEYPEYYVYLFNINNPPGLRDVSVSAQPLSRYIYFDEFEGEGDTLEDLATVIPGNISEAGIYKVVDQQAKTQEFWLTGKFTKNHFRTFFNVDYAIGLGGVESIETQFPSIVQEALQASLEWEDLADEAAMILVELLQNHLGAPDGDEVLPSLYGPMLSANREAYVLFKDFDASLFDFNDMSQVYRQMYETDVILDNMVEALMEFYTQGKSLNDLDQVVRDLDAVCVKIAIFFIDAFAPLIGEWRLNSFIRLLKGHSLTPWHRAKNYSTQVRELPSLVAGVQALAADPEIGQLTINNTQLLLRPMERLPDMTLSRFARDE